MKKMLISSLILNIIFLISVFYVLFKKGGMSYLKKKMGLLYTYSHSSYGPYYDQRKDLFETLPRDSNDIIFLGHSIIDGCELAELFKNPFIKNRGINGETTEGLLNRLDNITNVPPRKLFIMTGANDIGYGMPLEEILGNCTKIADTIKSRCPTTSVYVISVLPVGLDYSRKTAEVVKRFNKGLKAMAEKYDYTYIDLYPVFADQNDCMDAAISNDGSHLMGSGYLIYKEKLLPYLK